MTVFHRFLRDQGNMDAIMQMEVNKTKDYFDGYAAASKTMSSSTTEINESIERGGVATATNTTPTKGKTSKNTMTRKGDFYPMEIFPAITLSMAVSIMFGLDLAYEDPNLKHMVSTFRLWFDVTEPDNPVDFFPLLAKFPNKRLETVSQTIKEVERFNIKMVKDRVEVLSRRQISKESPSNSVDNAIFDMIAGEDLSAFEDEEYCREMAKLCYELIGAGFDTVATTLSWAVLYLIENPEVVQQCRAELTRKTTTSTATPLLNNKGDFDDEDLLSLESKTQYPYFMATIFEILRKSSASPMGLPHMSKCDTTVQGYCISKNTMVLPNIRQINNDAHDWPEPHEFRPERFLRDGSIDTRACNEIATFSVGLRRCPGDKVAITMIFVLLGTLIKRYDFDLVQPPIDMEPLRGLTAKPKHFLVKVNSV